MKVSYNKNNNFLAKVENHFKGAIFRLFLPCNLNRFQPPWLIGGDDWHLQQKTAVSVVRTLPGAMPTALSPAVNIRKDPGVPNFTVFGKIVHI